MRRGTIEMGKWSAPVVIALLVCFGCCKESEPVISDPGYTEKATAEVADADAEVRTILARADNLDGKADQVVSKCAVCALSMDGSPEHSLVAAGYTLHFCSAHCKDTFAHDVTKSVLAMKFPQE